MEFMRQLDVFSPTKHLDKRIDVIGVGATGSYVAWLLSKIGMENIHVWDFDKYEEHNAPNQNILLRHIGKKKVCGVAEMLSLGAGVTVTQHFEKVTGKTELGEIVFLLTDTMSSRKDIWEGALRLQPRTKLLIETRMGSNSGRVYAVDPTNNRHITEWESTLCDDSEAEVSACGASISIAPTASFIASIAVWQMIKYLTDAEVENEAIVCLNPLQMLLRNFTS